MYAWVSKWKYLIDQLLQPIALIIRPSCLRVERATIFFISISLKAERPAMIIVIVPNTKSTIVPIDSLVNAASNRMIK